MNQSPIQNSSLPELLAPAGTLSAALAAYAAGADAVYCGLTRFNAREMGTNFSYEDLSRLSARAKSTGKRFYLTLNTLVKQDEEEAFAETVAEAAALDPDAVILQDIGVARYLRENYPRIELHGSTQMGIHNSAGVEVARRLGLKRVILERQLPLTELGALASASSLELEVFIHGALCCSLSGRCLFSSWMGGWSGNRGRCKQPCRRRFHSVGTAGEGSGFFFSTQDLYTLDLIDELKQIPVASLKIEGRLKQPDYVSRTVAAYRLMLDAPAEDRSRVLGEARLILSGSYGRRWSHGFATGDDMQNLIQHDSMGVSGQLVGAVSGTRPGGFTMRTSRKVHLGDRIRVQPDSGDEGPSFTVTSLARDERSLRSAAPGQEVFVPFDRDVPRRGKVYRVGASPKGGYPDGAGLPLYRKPRLVALAIRVSEAGIGAAAAGLSWENREGFDRAEKHPLNEENLVAEFRRTRDPDVDVGECTVEVKGRPFIPAGRLKQLRREFWDFLLTRLPPEETDQDETTRPVFTPGAIFSGDPGPAVVMSSGDGSFALPAGAIEVRELPSMQPYNTAVEYQLPPFCPEGMLTTLRQNLAAAIKAGCRRFRISSLYQLVLFKGDFERDFEHSALVLRAGFPLPVTNALAAAELKEWGISRVQAWPELEKPAIEALIAASPVAIEVYRYGRPALLVTRARIPVRGEISDSRGGRFRVSDPDETGLTCLYPEKPMAIESLRGSADCFDYRQAEPDEIETVRFNFDRELV